MVEFRFCLAADMSNMQFMFFMLHNRSIYTSTLFQHLHCHRTKQTTRSRFFYKIIILTYNRVYSLWLSSGWLILKCTYFFTGTALDTFFCINFRVYKSVFIFSHVDCSLRTYIHTRPTATTILLFRK